MRGALSSRDWCAMSLSLHPALDCVWWPLGDLRGPGHGVISAQVGDFNLHLQMSAGGRADTELLAQHRRSGKVFADR